MKRIVSILTSGILLAAGSARGAGLGVSTNNVEYVVWQNQAALSNQVEVWNTNGTDEMTFTNTVSYTNCNGFESWLTVNPSNGTSYGERQGVWLQIDVTNVPPRTNAYEANVRVTAGPPGTLNATQDVRVTVLVQGVGLWVSTNIFSKVITAGQVAGEDVFQVANTGASPRRTMSYTVTATSLFSSTAWLNVSPASGDVQDNTNPVTILYTNAAGLDARWCYTGRVDVATLWWGTQTVDVMLRVNNRPGVAWTNAEDRTYDIMKGGSIESTTVEVWNASGEPRGKMNYTVSVRDDSYGWISVSNASGSSTGDHQKVYITYPQQVVTGLVAGVYSARVEVVGVDDATLIATTNELRPMVLQLTVKGTPDLKVSVTSLSTNLLENFSGTSWFSIANDGLPPHGSMSYTVTEVPVVEWVSVSPTTGVVTNEAAEITVRWNANSPGVSPGVYSNDLVVSAEGMNRTIRLTLTVMPRTPKNWELPTVAGTMYIGQTVTNYPGLWTNQARLTFGYQWKWAASKASGDGNDLSGETNYNYVITNADWMHGKYLRVAVTATDSEPFSMSNTAYSAWVDSAKVKALRADFNGDGITDLWFYNVLSGGWYASFGTTDSAEGIFGGAGMMAVPGDYDGDGYEDLGVYEWAHGMWHIFYLPRGDYVYGSLFGGTAEEAAATPVVADFDGDGATDVGLYYLGYWAILYSSRGSVSVVEPFADAWGEPVTGDWDGDGITELGVYDDGVWTLRLGNGSVVEQEFGGGGSSVLPALGDFDADGTTDLGVYDVGANQWRWRESRSGFEQSVSFGLGGTEAVPGYYDHDRSNDWAQVHMSADNDFIVWEVKRTTETNFPYRGQSFQQSIDRWRVSW